MNLFKGKIRCLKCNHNYNYKNDNGIPIYICSGYKNYGFTYCKRNAIREKDLLDIITLHLSSGRKRGCKTAVLSYEFIQEIIDRIEIDGDSISIYYKDGSKSEWDKSNLTI